VFQNLCKREVHTVGIEAELELLRQLDLPKRHWGHDAQFVGLSEDQLCRQGQIANRAGISSVIYPLGAEKNLTGPSAQGLS
jgi:hypothetical protein